MGRYKSRGGLGVPRLVIFAFIMPTCDADPLQLKELKYNERGGARDSLAGEGRARSL